MMKLNFKISFIFVICAILAACDNENIGDTSRKVIPLDFSTRTTSEELNKFYLKYTLDVVKHSFKTASKENLNVIVSPLSTSMMLGMVANGIMDENSEELMKYLGISNLHSFNEFSKVMMNSLHKSDKKTEVLLANSLWYNIEKKLSKEFHDKLADYFNAKMKGVDFNHDILAINNDINEWCSHNTNGRIDNYFGRVEYLDGFTDALLLNSVYFKSIWSDNTFNKENTQKSIFYGMSHNSEVDMMSSFSTHRYYNFDDYFEYCYLTFGNSTFQMELVLPRKEISVTKSLELFTIEELEKLRTEGNDCQLTLKMPRFKVDKAYNVGDVLRYAGNKSLVGYQPLCIFDPEDFGILSCKQATSLQVDETGVIAAAISSAKDSAIAPELGKKYEMTLNRPFFFFIREFSTGACILSGLIADL